MRIDSWRAGCNHDGWHLAQLLWQQIKKEEEDWSQAEVESEEAPILIKAVPRLESDVNTLKTHEVQEASSGTTLVQSNCKSILRFWRCILKRIWSHYPNWRGYSLQIWAMVFRSHGV
jgi:hypothetical protein